MGLTKGTLDWDIVVFLDGAICQMRMNYITLKKIHKVMIGSPW
jgi:hypothetical protein